MKMMEMMKTTVLVCDKLTLCFYLLIFRFISGIKFSSFVLLSQRSVANIN